MFTPQEALVQGKAAAQKALQLHDKLASAHYAPATAYLVRLGLEECEKNSSVPWP
jgi:hypothetical protein